ncbi:YifB family Mg chelatase-like AAA ATPase [Granulicoccus phenolivorans]|uniref:YifB family Mg chelatase-like AAA ATPase n=1 Tax=Granulicoccus phenolivorans TaxID=266854 RepID=UPI000428FA0E|nr:YifB family Mg chelatase-like AAA ATPase [Granulicoccus phenolivorans]
MSTPATARSVALNGLEGSPVEIEVAVGAGLPRTVLVGLPDTSLYEARDRCRAAVASCGLRWPDALVTINLTPATLPKAGSHYDLGIVAAVLAAADLVPRERLAGTVFMGELGLDGRVRPVRGILPGLLAAHRQNLTRCIVPAAQAGEARLVAGMAVQGVSRLQDLVELLHGRPVPDPLPEPASGSDPVPASADLSDIVGQIDGKWALEVAAAGRHHLFLHGPPGVGKTMLAERLPGLLPDLSVTEALDVAAVASLAGHDLADQLPTRPPYADPHHTASVASLVGGGARFVRPGAISLAHRGVLFLDEAAEFSPRALEALRRPLELRKVTISRSSGAVEFPSDFQLVLAANPCPCGLAGTPGANCTCPPHTVRRYRDRISGPILDRIDIQQNLAPMSRASLRLAARTPAEGSDRVAQRVAAARERSGARLQGTGWTTNGEVPGPYLRKSLPLPDGFDLLETALGRGLLTLRGVDKCLRLAWTIADLQGRSPRADDVRAAVGMRRGDSEGVKVA